MSKKKNNTQGQELVLTSSVPDVLDQLNKKLAELKHIEESVYKTSGNLEGFGDIKQEMKLDNLIRAFSSVRGREDAYNNAAKELGISPYPVFTVSGGNAADWKQDILLRKAIIEHKTTLDKLNTFKEKMSKFMSEADQKAILLKEMNEFFAQS